MKTKTVEIIASPGDPHFVGDSIRVHNFIPGRPKLDMKRMNPFIMLDYNSTYHFPPTDKKVLVCIRTEVLKPLRSSIRVGSHHNSSGGEGDIQWMTASRVVLHKKYQESEWSKTGGDFQMVQLYINLQ